MYSKMYLPKYVNNAFSSKIYGIIDKLLKEKSKPDETMVVPVMSLKKFTDEAEAVS